MKIIATSGKYPIRSWCNEIEPGCMSQLENLAKLPFLAGPVCLMPDGHQGYGMPIGGVVATKGVICCNMVGVDIGCGVSALKTDIKVADINISIVKEIIGHIREKIPVGFNHREKLCNDNEMPDNTQLLHFFDSHKVKSIIELEYHSAMRQLGTLGGGNHFLEVQKGSSGMCLRILSFSDSFFRIASMSMQVAVNCLATEPISKTESVDSGMQYSRFAMP